MKRKPLVHSRRATSRRQQAKLKQIEERFALLMLLLQHNFDKVLAHQARSSRR